MKIGNLAKNLKRVLDSNAPVILTGIAVSGAFLTTYLSARGAYKASDVVRERQAETPSVPLSNQEKFIATYKFYAPAAVSLVGTSACMIMATKIGLDRTAAVAGAFVVAERANDQYRDKVKEILGENKHNKVEDAVATDQVNAVQIPSTMVPNEENVGEQIFLDRWSGRTFLSTREHLDKAVNEINHEMIYGGYASLSEFYSKIGLEDTEESYDIGWNKERLLELAYTPVMKGDRPIVAFSFDRKPMPGFQDGDI